MTVSAFCRVVRLRETGGQLRSVASRQLEQEISHGGQRWTCGNHRLRRDGDAPGTRLRDSQHRYRPRCRYRWALGAGAHGARDRFRASGGSRHHAGGQGDHRVVLWRLDRTVLFQWLLARRPGSSDGSPALPAGLRRHHRRRSRQLLDAPLHGRPSMDCPGDGHRSGRLHSRQPRRR